MLFIWTEYTSDYEAVIMTAGQQNVKQAIVMEIGKLTMKTWTKALTVTLGATVLAFVLIGSLYVQPVSATGLDEAALVEIITSPEDEALTYMREEEKLAHDVYVTLYDLWGLRIFDNISRAESQHMSAVLDVMESRELDDPAAGNDLGEFTNPELQSLYDGLVAKGSKSQIDALIVGATIEDVDIADLIEALESATDDDVRWMFENLLRGSENHMRAFLRNLARYGETYEPQYIDAETYESIVGEVTDPTSSSRGYRGSRRVQKDVGGLNSDSSQRNSQGRGRWR